MKETYSERTILLKLKQMEKIQIKTMEILHRIEKLLDMDEEMEEEMEQKKPFQDNYNCTVTKNHKIKGFTLKIRKITLILNLDYQG